MTRLIRSVLVANRGEIARRIIRTCRRLGIETVAVHSDADAGLAFVEEANRAIPLGGNAVRDSYLSLEKLSLAIRQSGVDAVHPGYGMLSEAPELARLAEELGVVFIGPSPEALRALGDKVQARGLAARAGLEPPPGSDGPVDKETAGRVAARVGYPVMVKAVQGGGGIGMQRATDEAELTRAVETCSARAGAAFADARVYVERSLEGARHIEVQVARDQSGNTVALGDRECSVQRRHQKLFEECPSPAAFLTNELRQRLYAGSRALLDVAKYVGVATVEFLVVAKPVVAAHFLEVNARIQVEHPVTEAVFDVDIVELQLALAEGRSLDPSLSTRTPNGHAIEVRIYAEDPARGFIPQPGTLATLRWPNAMEGLRVEACYRQGELITPHYDPLIAKVICHGPERKEALARVAKVLSDTEIELVAPKGVRTSNLAWLRALLRDPRILLAEYDTTTTLTDFP
jgi:acetyl/propionyl-CoA carboxylase alpha subunit